MTRRRIISLAIIVILLVALITISVIFWDNFRGIIPLIKRPSIDITEAIPGSSDIEREWEKDIETEDVSDTKQESEKESGAGEQYGSSIFQLKNGFSISILSSDVPSARVLAEDPEGNLWVSQTGIGKVTRIIIKDGIAVGEVIALEGLNNPHGLAFDPSEPYMLYIAEEDKISRVGLDANGELQGELEKVIDLPPGGRHYTRTISFGDDGRLYVSIGSTCNVCNESDERYASIYSLKKDGTDFRVFATGLRNSVFFRWHPVTRDMWATEMGRDNLGDDLPPDEINIILEGRDYGWPYCYGKNIQDMDFDTSKATGSRCSQSEPSYIDIPAHSAPLGIDFIPSGNDWPPEYEHDLLVAFHGSWNRSIPTGYKIVRFNLDSNGVFVEMEDFISGWLTDDGSVLGRPADIMVLSGGIAYISDDRAGVIYKVEYQG